MRDEIIAAKTKLEAEIGVEAIVLHDRVTRFIAQFDQEPAQTQVFALPSEAQQALYHRLIQQFGEVVPIFHKIVMLELMLRFEDGATSVPASTALQQRQRAEFARILKAISLGTQVFDWNASGFAIDLGLCSLRLLPLPFVYVGPAAIPQSLDYISWTEKLRATAFLKLRLPGVLNFYQLHQALPNAGPTNNARWQESFLALRQILTDDPSVTGFFVLGDPLNFKIAGESIKTIAGKSHAQTFSVRASSLTGAQPKKNLSEIQEKTLEFIVWPRADFLNYASQIA